MRQCELVVLVVVALGIVSAPGHADIFQVPLHYETIQAGIDASDTGDTVLVALGTYAGDGNRGLDFTGTNRVLMSESGAEATVIDCGGEDIGYTAWSGEDSTSVVRGFTFTNGYRSSNGGAIYVTDSSPIIEDCIFTGNEAGMNGGAIYYSNAPAAGVIRNCSFYGNTARYRGGAISISGCSATIRGCVIYDNTVTEAGAENQGGGGIHTGLTSSTITECTIVANSGAPGAGGIGVYGGGANVTNTVIAFNTSGGATYGVTPDHSIIYQNVGDAPPSGGERENLDTDPLFCDLGNRDLRVCGDSVCLAADPENPWGEKVGALETGCGDCDSPVEDHTWGAIKAMYHRQ